MRATLRDRSKMIQRSYKRFTHLTFVFVLRFVLHRNELHSYSVTYVFCKSVLNDKYLRKTYCKQFYRVQGKRLSLGRS